MLWIKYTLGTAAIAASIWVAGSLPKDSSADLRRDTQVESSIPTLLATTQVAKMRTSTVLAQAGVGANTIGTTQITGAEWVWADNVPAVSFVERANLPCLNHGDLYANLVGKHCGNSVQERAEVSNFAGRLSEYILTSASKQDTLELTQLHTKLIQSTLQSDIEKMRGDTHLVLVELVNMFNAAGLEELPLAIRIANPSSATTAILRDGGVILATGKAIVDDKGPTSIEQYAMGFQLQLLYLQKDPELAKRAKSNPNIKNKREISIGVLEQIIQEIQKQAALNPDDTVNQERSTQTIEALKEKYFARATELFPTEQGQPSFNKAEERGARIAQKQGGLAK